MTTALIVLAAALAVLAAPLTVRTVLKRRAAARARITSPNGIVEGRYVRIGGVEQWLQIRGEDRANPVLLVVHGGPGSPYSVFTAVQREWERHFTVVHWDRRGCGRTLRRNGMPAPRDLTFERMVADGIEVAEHVRAHLGKDRVILMAGSMGTIVGLPMARRRPDLFSAYVGTDFYVDMVANERQGRADTLARLRAAGNTRGVAALQALDPDPRTWDVKAWGRRMQWSMGTDPANPNGGLKTLFSLLLTKPDYSLRDVVAWLKGFAAVRDAMFAEFMRFDAREGGTRLEIPFHLFQGAQDVVTLTGPAVEYFAEVDAPAKSLVLIEGASHFAAFTHPAEFLAALRTVPAAA
ncbi:alpha/beta hydrolase [Dactylosporangium aurantiacum]|uniref:Alpha/beta hydrolase n=1 Tax=Dactylosporangium aurantiacum TaxID=35754 RepID=A0A9Q9IHT4_9ACTN|nr:alpha/beta hydrolase [Dactylosporangium aurantiacum]MDG6109336.1 alpha/beta hydrolase [Dactylosporangium aurantiacum]UWZ56444.1 alpha/beta hydrolase [Dactylosporangium aurantiacum]